MRECYAKAIGGCEGKITREHPLSKNLLLKLGDMEVEAPWLPGGRRPMTESSMTARVLCEGHNRALSPYDNEVGRLFDTINASLERRLDRWETINGDYLERWALKVIFADAAAGTMVTAAGQRHPTKESPPLDLLRIVFDGASFQNRCGMYHTEPRGTARATLGVHYNYTPKHDRLPEMLHGITIQLLGFWFITTWAPLGADWSGITYRPTGFSSWDSTMAGIRFAWSGANATS